MILQPLSVVWNFDPVLFSIGSLDIRYYGLMWALAILIGAKFFDNFVNREGLPAKVSESIFIYGNTRHDPRRAARPLSVLRHDGIPFEAVDHHHGIPRRRNGQPRRGHRPADRVVALLAPQQTALYLVAGPHYDSGGHRRCDRAVGQPVQLGDFRPGDDPAVGLRVRPFAQVGGRVRPCGGAPDAIYEALCYLATFGILCWLYYRRDIARRRPGILFGIGLIGTFLTRFFIEYIKTEQEPFEVGWALDMGQWLSIPFILLGIYMIWRGATRPERFRPRCRKPRPQRLKRRKNEREPDGRADRQACRQPAGRRRGDFSARRRLALHRAAGSQAAQPANRTAAEPHGGLHLAAAGRVAGRRDCPRHA